MSCQLRLIFRTYLKNTWKCHCESRCFLSGRSDPHFFGDCPAVRDAVKRHFVASLLLMTIFLFFRLLLEIQPKSSAMDFTSEALCAASVFLCETVILLHRVAPRFTEFHRDIGFATRYLVIIYCVLFYLLINLWCMAKKAAVFSVSFNTGQVAPISDCWSSLWRTRIPSPRPDWLREG